MTPRIAIVSAVALALLLLLRSSAATAPTFAAPVARPAGRPASIASHRPASRATAPTSAGCSHATAASCDASPAPAPADHAPPGATAERGPLASTWLPAPLAERLDRAGQEAVARLARRLVPSAAQLMRARNPRATPLDPADAAALRPVFGDVVDRAEVVFGARFPDETLHTGSDAAVTFGRTIYVRAPHRPGDPAQRRLLAHELVHVRQFERLGSDLPRFAEEVARQLVEARWDEEATPFEREANGLSLDLPGGVAEVIDGLGRPR